MVTVCNLSDNDGFCSANDGEPCAACAERIEAEGAYYLRTWRTASPAERDPAAYARDMADAGRGWLEGGAS